MAAYNAAHPEIEEQEQPKTEVSYNYTPPEFGGEAGNVKQEEGDAPTGTSRGQASMVRFYSQEQQPPSNIGQYNSVNWTYSSGTLRSGIFHYGCRHRSSRRGSGHSTPCFATFASMKRFH
jgi:hypothetical protein